MLNITADIRHIFPLTQNVWKHGCGNANSLTSVAKAINWRQPQILGTEVFAKLIKSLIAQGIFTAKNLRGWIVKESSLAFSAWVTETG